MVDVMAPVFDHLVDERDAPSRSRRAQWWQRDTRRQDDDESDSDKDHDERGHDVDEQQGNPTTFDPLNAFAGLLSVPVSALLGTSASSLPAPTPSSASRTTSLTLSSSSSSSSSTVGLPTVPANSPIANNPQVPAEQTGTTSSLPTSSAKTSPATTSPVTSSVTIMMTTSVSLPTTVSTSSFIDTLFPSSTTVSSTSTTPTSSVTAAFANQPSPSIYLTNTDNGLNTFRDGEHHDSDDDHDPPPPSGGLSPTGEDVLISAGSIGAFILISFVCWMGWRMYKKSKRRGNDRYDGDDLPPNALLAKIPYFGRTQRGWNEMGGVGPSPMYEQANPMDLKPGLYSAESRSMAPSQARQGPTVLPQLDTNLSYSQANPFSASTQSTAFNQYSAQSPQGSSTQNTLPYSQQQPVILPPLQTNFSPANPFASPEDAAVADNMSPSSAAQYGNGTMRTFETATTDRSRMPDPYYNQSELARQASTAFDPARRAVYRASELSSISSGFGDGDIIVPPPAAVQPGSGPRPFSFVKTPDLSRNSSVANRSEIGSNGQRDTVYTTTSEDMPVRYRSVNSWVNQQTGRAQRNAQRSDAEDVPPVPDLPPEQRLTMMMDDGEEPRRYEDTLSSQPPVPTLPTNHS